MSTASRILPAVFTALLMAGVSAAQVVPFGTATATPAASAMQWGADLAAAKAAAKQSGKLVLVHFDTNACTHCKVVDSQVFSQPAVAKAVHERFVPVKINADDAPMTAKALGVDRFPTDVVLTPDGQVIDRMVSPQTPMAYVGRVMNAVARAQSRPGAGFQLAAAQSPYNGPMNNAYANLAIPPAASQPPVQPTLPQQPTNTLAGGPAAPSKPMAPPAAKVVSNPHTAPATTPKQPAPPVVASTQLPPGAPPLGLEGYCPVTLKHARQWKKGDPRWGAVHRGRTYLFVGQSERDEFLKTGKGDEYSPVFSGLDPVLKLERGESLAGKRAYGVEYLNSVYLFSSEETLNRFWSNPSAYANGVRQAMSAGQGRTVR